LPPFWRGGSVEIAPQAAGGATPMTPKNGRSSISMPQGRRPIMRLASSALWISARSGKS